MKSHDDPHFPSAKHLATLTALGAAASLWALFLWVELVKLRAGQEPICLSADPKACSSLWDGPFASAVHSYTHLPIALWGVVWGVAAFSLSLFALYRRAGDRDDGPGFKSAVTGTRLIALGGVVGVGIFAVVSIANKALCVNCLISYLITLRFAWLALFDLRKWGFPLWARGALTSTATSVLLYGTFFVLGASTPKSKHSQTLEFESEVSSTRLDDRSGPEDFDKALKTFLEGVDMNARQNIADDLLRYQSALNVPPDKKRSVIGNGQAKVLVTAWTDPKCPHCEHFHNVIHQLSEYLPPSLIAYEPRYFPMDSACNPSWAEPDINQARCDAAKAMLCMEKIPQAYETYVETLFERGKQLTRQLILDLGTPYIARHDLNACIESQSVQSMIETDVAQAQKYDFKGTPLVLVNGRQVTGYPHFLHAIALAKGNERHPLFDSMLPPPQALKK